MRCVDLIRELSIPTGTLGSAVISDHLAQCPQCAAWVERDTKLTQVWEATRPPELTDQAWDRIWAKVSEDHQAATSPVLVGATSTPVSPRRGSRRWISVFVAAQAAAILVATLVLVTHRQPPRPVGPEPAVADLAATPIEIEPGQPVLISLDGPQSHVRDIALNDDPNHVAPDYLTLNYLESIAE